MPTAPTTAGTSNHKRNRPCDQRPPNPEGPPGELDHCARTGRRGRFQGRLEGEARAKALQAGIEAGDLVDPLVIAVAEADHLDESAAGFEGAPAGADLLEDVERVAPELRHRLAEPAHEPRVLGQLLLRDDVAVGLK